MLFTADAWAGIADGSITVTFRTWSRPQAKVGGRYRVGGSTIEATAVERVEAGSRLVQDAGGTMDEIVASVQRVAQIITEISTATSEQSQGIGSVNASVSQLDQMTQQNAALVEQTAASAQALREQAALLAQRVTRFQLP